MEFLVFTYVGLAAAVVHQLLPGPHRVGPASSAAVGIVAAWSGALLAGTFVKGGWAFFGPLQLAGGIVAAIGAITLLEVAAQAYLRSEARGLP